MSSTLKNQLAETLQPKLHTCQYLFQQLIDNYSLGAISILDKNFNYVVIGGEMVRQYGFLSESLIGKRVFPQATDDIWAIVEPKLRGVLNGTILRDFEVLNSLTNQFFTIDAFPLYEPDGQVDHIAVFTRDITEKKETEAYMKIALEKEKKNNELKSRFVSLASHEFRTPLTAIQSSVELIKAYADREEMAGIYKHVERINRSIITLTGILDDFLSLNKLEEERITANLKEVNLPETIEDAYADLKNIFKDGQSFEYQHEGDKSFQLDPHLLKNIVINLLSNAIKYSPEGAPINVVSFVSEEKAGFWINDRGIGISAEDQKNLFNRFYRASNVGSTQGTGLGLFIVKRYTEMMNGTLGCRSELGKGSTFWVEFKAATN
ncbi:MAG: PAS domain-containing sensor histidine kinase [Saprospiraceae bacterium]|nr:PAS domain-containing sensor histidine kinase [Saprospiraceae bacterium]MCF8250560.1 PAS domain-containing sensor histidine kinase [Saprospiraceae bacterium]MCF8279700.1 PAS domain-containing sensor histidine kinase [Bacteroidales bacterium]MCF8312486.1 PAS domain-containing sensor histidine kinase [Saprospiraceae bacterium]MCF8440697.1 PAS domain-containing sensor histidine kinase [Saprospiraceae bacterium]